MTQLVWNGGNLDKAAIHKLHRQDFEDFGPLPAVDKFTTYKLMY